MMIDFDEFLYGEEDAVIFDAVSHVFVVVRGFGLERGNMLTCLFNGSEVGDVSIVARIVVPMFDHVDLAKVLRVKYAFLMNEVHECEFDCSVVIDVEKSFDFGEDRLAIGRR